MPNERPSCCATSTVSSRVNDARKNSLSVVGGGVTFLSLLRHRRSAGAEILRKGRKDAKGAAEDRPLGLLLTIALDYHSRTGNPE